MLTRPPRRNLELPALVALAFLLTLPTVVLADDRPITGRVLDEAGLPVAGAVVEVIPRLGRGDLLRHRIDGTEPAVAERTLTDEDGRFELPAQPLGLWRIHLRAAGYFPARRSLSPTPEPAAPQPARLRRADETFTVRVVTADGAAVPGAEVDAFVYVSTTDRWQHMAQVHDTTGDRGKVAIEVPADGVQVFATARVRRDIEGRSTWTVTPAASARQGEGSLTLRLPADPGHRAVRFVRQGTPLPDVAVADFLGPRALAGDDGVALVQPPSASLEGMEAFPMILAPDASLPWPELPDDTRTETGTDTGPGTDAETGPDAEQNVSAGPNSHQPIELEIPAPAELQGRIVTPDGQPIEGAVIFSQGSPFQEPLLALSARDGVFSLPDRDDLGHLRVVADGYQSDSLDPSSRGAEPGVLPDVVLGPARDLVAWVVDDTHRPLPDVTVEVLQQRNRSRSGALQWSWDRDKSAISDAEGRIVLHDLSPGSRLLLGLRHDDFAQLDVEADVPTVGDGSDEPVWILQPGLRVGGRIVDEGGEALGGVRVTLAERQPSRSSRAMQRSPEAHPSAESARDGRFEIPRLAAGTYELEADLAGRGVTAKIVEIRYPGPVDIGDVELGHGVRLKGRVIDLEGQPVAGVTVSAIPMRSVGGSHSDDYSATSDANGRFEIVGLPAERPLSIFGDGRSHRFDSIQLRPPFPDSLTIRVQPQSIVSGRVVDEDGRPAPPGTMLTVQVRQDSGSGGSSGRTLSSDGAFEERGLDAGHLLISAQAPDGRRAAYQGRIGAGESVAGLELMLEAGVEVSGRVTTADGGPVIGSQVQAHPKSSEPAFGEYLDEGQTSATDASGRYRLANVRPGPTRIAVRGDSHAPGHREIDITASGASGIDLVVEARESLPGLLTDDVGLPVPGAEIEAYGDGLQMRASTDPDGRFELPAQLNQGSPIVVRLEDRPEFHFNEPARFVDDGELRLVLPRAVADLRIEIFGLDETALAAAQVYIHSRSHPTVGSSLFTKPGPDGVLDIPNVHAASWGVEVRSGAQSRSGRVEIEPAGGSPSVTLDFGDGIELSGRLIVDGAPLADATARLHGTEPGSPSYSNNTDGVGTFRLSGVELGRYHLHVDHHVTALRHAQWLQVTGSEDLTLGLETSTVSGRVVPSRGSQIVLRQGDLTLRPYVDPDGTFRIRTTLVGAARLEAEGDLGADAADVTLVPGAEIEVADLVLRPPDA